ncbi:acetate--CoA ligase family protein [Chelatococcus reniformis]|uniref:6-carboxyhexanoate--CoA ligase n=1 Tax=Chelatococcus reniformis TaxID=1494448 RepID=A0A916X8W1_9HYPH|nr:acetate--CoA ligase family protein [Chelatococcus reniformis]GGC55397.1 6-carboxyhexanoate--CoA ligase [Chelatococcus reniformis]
MPQRSANIVGTEAGGRRFIDALLAPRSIALVGASDEAAKTAGRPLQFLRAAGYEGTIFPVNARRDSVQGERAWRSLADLPEAPEHAFILTPTDAAVAAVAECAAAGVKVATVLAAGFSDAGAEGQARQASLARIAAETGLRILGPSSLGVVNGRARLVLTANAAFAEPGLPAGGTFVASQSGSLIGALVSRGKARGIGFAGLVSVGGEVDLGIGEICTATLDDPGIDAYLLFLEGIRRADDLRAFALEAARRGKPIVAYKLGRSAAAAELAVSHTGALAGEDAAVDAFLSDLGIARVDTFEGLLEAPALLRRTQPRRAASRVPTVGVVTTTGGGAAMAVDQLALRGIDVAAPSEETFRRLAAAGVEAAHGRIVDLTLAGTRPPVMKAALDTLLAAPEFDLVLAVVGSSARSRPDLAVAPIAASLGATKPLAAFIVPEAPEALRRLEEAGVPAFRTPESCADAVGAALLRRPPTAIARPAVAPALPGSSLDELEAYGVLGRLGVPHAPAVALTIGEPVPAELPFAYPVAAKLLSHAVTHKSDVGGVVLAITGREELDRAIRDIAAAAARHGVSAERVLVQPMRAALGEALVGYRVDPQVGPLIMLAAGGVLTELYRDRSLRAAPIDTETAWAMIAEVKGLRALEGYRGRPAGDMEALAQVLVAMSHLAGLADPGIYEAEVNPLLIGPVGQGVEAVDAVVRLKDNTTTRGDEEGDR